MQIQENDYYNLKQTRIMKYKIDEVHSNVSFRVKLLGLTAVGGQFNTLNGHFSKEGDNWEGAKVDFTIPLSGIDTGVSQRDEHLRSGDWFNAEEHPNITFKSKEFKKNESKGFEIIGDLSIKGVTQEETFSVRLGGSAIDQNGQEKIGFSGKTKINAKDYGLSVGEKLENGAVLLGKRIPIRVDVQLISE